MVETRELDSGARCRQLIVITDNYCNCKQVTRSGRASALGLVCVTAEIELRPVSEPSREDCAGGERWRGCWSGVVDVNEAKGKSTVGTCFYPTVRRYHKAL
jgi:hypothetical protein